MTQKILVIPEGNWLAHTSRALCVALKLREAGAHVVFACSGTHSNLPRLHGFETYPLTTKEGKWGLSRARLVGSSYTPRIVRKYIRDEIDIIRRIKPCAVLGDFRITLGTSTEFTDTQYIALINSYWTPFYSGIKPVSQTLGIMKLFGPRFKPFLFPTVRKLLECILTIPFNFVRKHLGLSPYRNIYDVLSSRDHNLLVDLPEFMPVSKLSHRYRYIGPILWEPPIDDPPWMNHLPGRRPSCYVTLGSTGELDGLMDLLKLLAAKGWFSIVSGDLTERDLSLGLASNIVTARLVPGLRVARHVDLVVCHGGNGTIYQSLANGKPVVALPTNYDQEINAAQLAFLELGKVVLPRRTMHCEVVDAMEEVLFDSRYGANARRMSALISRYDAAATAANFLMKIC